MATTTNYSWSTPDDTALVKDGAAAIRSLGTAIDSTVFTNAGAAINKTIVDAKGDIIVATAADTVARLAVGGTNGQVLTVDSTAATGLAYTTISAGSLTLLSTTSLSSTSTTVSSISQSYKNLLLIVKDLQLSSDDQAIRLTFENNGGRHSFGRFGTDGNSFNTGAGNDIGYMEIGRGGTSSNIYQRFNAAIIINDYTSTGVKFVYGNSWARTNSGNNYGAAVSGTYTGTTAIDEIKIAAEGATLSVGSLLIYGVN
jgi:hypothetical protein